MKKQSFRDPGRQHGSQHARRLRRLHFQRSDLYRTC